MMDDSLFLKALPERVNANERLVWRGRHLDVDMLLEIGDRPFLVVIRQGRIASVRRGPFVMPAWNLALRADAEAWSAFWQAAPVPGFHDVMALVKARRLRIEGDLHAFMSHLLYFKDVLACLRAQEAAR